MRGARFGARGQAKKRQKKKGRGEEEACKLIIWLLKRVMAAYVAPMGVAGRFQAARRPKANCRREHSAALQVYTVANYLEHIFIYLFVACRLQIDCHEE